MKNRVVLVLLLSFLVAPSAAFAANWVLVKETSSLGWKMYSYVDTETVLKKDSVLTFWYNFKVVKPLGTSEKVQKIEANLSTHQYRVLEAHLFVNGKPDSQSLTPSKFAKDNAVKDEIGTALQYAKEETVNGPVPSPTTGSPVTGDSQAPPKNEGTSPAPAGTSAARTLFTTTLLRATIPQVQDIIIEVMTREKFAIEEVDDNKVVVGKQEPAVLFMPGAYSRVRFNLLVRDENIKLLVTKVDTLGPQSQQQPIDPLVPLIKEIKNRVDGTPKDQVINETVTSTAGTASPEGKPLGIRLGAKNAEGYIVIENVAPGSKAAEAGLASLDIILEVNGRSAKEFEVNGLQSYLAGKWAQKASILIVYSREGKTDLATIKE